MPPSLETFSRARELSAVLPAVREASLLCRIVQQEPDRGVFHKTDGTPVTAADYSAQALLCEAVGTHFTADPIMAEEKSEPLLGPENDAVLARVVDEVRRFRPAATAESICRWIDRSDSEGGAGRYWAIDPIDGTQGFVRGDHYAVCIALIENGLVQMGIVGCPKVSDERSAAGIGTILFAVRGQGCWSVPLEPRDESTENAAPRAVRVSSCHRSAEARFCESVEPGHTWHESGAAIRERLGSRHPSMRIDSQAKYALVARGDAEIYMRVPVTRGRRERIWDHAPGSILVTEAGGRVTDLEGRPQQFQYGLRLAQNRGLVASNGPFHDEILETLRELGIGRDM